MNLSNLTSLPGVVYITQPSAALLAETLVALANGDGGTIIFGIAADGTPTAQTFEAEDVQGLLYAAQQLCRPLVQSSWEKWQHDATTIFGVSVPRSSELHALPDGRVLVRVGRDNKPLSGDQIRQLANGKTSSEFELQAVPSATFADLDAERIAEYFAKRQHRQRRSLPPLPQLLVEIGAITPQQQPTISGMLLFGKDPQFFIPGSDVLFVRFAGIEPRGADGLVGYGRRVEIGGALSRVIEQTWQVVNEEMHYGAVVRGLEREEIAEYPIFAVREALVNAVCHRDYRLQGRRIELRMFADRLEIISPGGLPGYITLDNIVEEHFSRNPRLVNGLFQWGYIEELGLGVDRMYEAMAQAGLQPPVFRAQSHAFTVTLYNKREHKGSHWSAPRAAPGMNERQARVLAFLREHSSITNGKYQELCPDVSAETLRLDLVDLASQGILVKIGAKKGTYYVLK